MRSADAPIRTTRTPNGSLSRADRTARPAVCAGRPGPRPRPRQRVRQFDQRVDRERAKLRWKSVDGQILVRRVEINAPLLKLFVRPSLKPLQVPTAPHGLTQRIGGGLCAVDTETRPTAGERLRCQRDPIHDRTRHVWRDRLERIRVLDMIFPQPPHDGIGRGVIGGIDNHAIRPNRHLTGPATFAIRTPGKRAGSSMTSWTRA